MPTITGALTGIQPLYRTGEEEGGDPRDYTKEYGGIPTLPKYVTDTKQTIGTDVYSQLMANLPSYAEMTGQSSENILANLRGEISRPVMGQLATAAAERGVGGGFGAGSPNEQAKYLADILRMSQGLTALGEQQLGEAIKRTPIQESKVELTTRSLEEDIAKLKGAPDPKKAADEALRKALEGIMAGRSGGGIGMGAYGTPSMKSLTRPDEDVDPLSGAYSWQNKYLSDMLKSRQAEEGLKTSIVSDWFRTMAPDKKDEEDEEDHPYGSTAEIDEFGDEWIWVENGQQMNLSTGEYYDPEGDEFYDLE